MTLPSRPFDPAALHDHHEQYVAPCAANRPAGALLTKPVMTRQVDPALDLLVMVHPGSLIGPYEMFLEAVPDAMDARPAIAALAATWPGDTVMLLGDFTDQLAWRDTPGRLAVAEMSARLWERGSTLFAPAFAEDLADASGWIVRNMAAAARPRVVVTGIWADLSDGCVAEVAGSLRRYCKRVEIPDFTPCAR